MPRVLVGNPERQGPPRPAGSLAPLLAVTGVALLLVGGADLLLVWIPPAFGNREWEFGSASATLNGLPVLLMGMALSLGAALDARRLVGARVVGVLSLLTTLALAAVMVLYLTNVPLALSATEGPLRTGILKAIAKALVQGAVYPVVFGYLAWRGLRAGRMRRGTEPAVASAQH